MRKLSQTQMKVRRRQGLPPEHSAVENNFATALESNPDEFVRRYKDRFGNVISTDSARSMWHEYEKNPGEMSFAVQYPAMALAKEVWQRELAATPKPDGSVLFLAGGAGAGKTHALNNVPEVAALAAKADLVYDSTMGNYQFAVERLQQALDSGRKAVIVYVFRPLEDVHDPAPLHRAVLCQDPQEAPLLLAGLWHDPRFKPEDYGPVQDILTWKLEHQGGTTCSSS